MPFITVTYPPKYPLTESEKKWLEEREQHKRNGEQFYSCADCEHRSAEYDLFDGWCDNEGACPIELGYRDLQDAAEFSARVAARLTGLKAEELPCYPNFLCPYSAKLIGSCKACYLKHARLAVEQEMDA